MSRLIDPVGPGDHVLGRQDAPVTLVEYLDYECPFCAEAHYAMLEVLRRVGDVVRFVARNFPLSQLHRHALLAAEAAEAAGAQGGFWPMHSMLFDNRDALELPDVESYAGKLGLDVTRFAGDLDQSAYLPRVQKDFRSGVRSGVNGTPAFFLDGMSLDGDRDADSLVYAISGAARRGHQAHRHM
jgi:protein-disulfide isomerase